MERWTTGTKKQVLVHELEFCVGQYCVVHAPMPGPWELWPTDWDDPRRLAMRVCPCGYRHPAAEEYQVHNYAVLTHKCCRVPWHRCAPEIMYDRHWKPGFPGGGDFIDGEIVPDRRELES
jgi:hypothetical protein